MPSRVIERERERDGVRVREVRSSTIERMGRIREKEERKRRRSGDILACWNAVLRKARLLSEVEWMNENSVKRQMSSQKRACSQTKRTNQHNVARKM